MDALLAYFHPLFRAVGIIAMVLAVGLALSALGLLLSGLTQ